MKLTVKNFGPIKSAEVDIKPMTVFVGHSNTGKSYLAILIYTVVKVLKAPTIDVVHDYFWKYFNVDGDLNVKNILSDAQLSDFADGLPDVCLKDIRKRWKDEAIRCFGGEWQNITGQNDAPTSIIISSNDNKIPLDLFSLEEYKFPPNSAIQEIKESAISRFKNEAPSMHPAGTYQLGHWMLPQIADLLNSTWDVPQSGVTGSLQREFLRKGANTHYLPAARGGFIQIHRILVSALVARAPTLGLTKDENVPFAGILADFLEKVIMITDKYTDPDADENIVNLSQKIENDIMHGEIKVKMSVTGYPDFRYKFEGKDTDTEGIPLMHASSSVAELAPMILFIRYYLSPGDVFIVEEPEAHLHPEAQRIIAGILVELVNAGVYVIITTHSDYILEQTSNYVHASGIKEKIDKQALNEEEISVYSFEQPEETERRSTAVEKILFDSNTGFLPQTHLDVSSDLYNETVNLLEKRDNNDQK